MKPAINLEGMKANKFKFEPTFIMGSPEYLVISYDEKPIGRFYWNMGGYNQDFYLRNAEGLACSLPRNAPKTKCIPAFKEALKEGFTNLIGF